MSKHYVDRIIPEPVVHMPGLAICNTRVWNPYDFSFIVHWQISDSSDKYIPW